MLAGGLTVLMLDLGRPDRMIVAATHYNASSVFAWNVLHLLGHGGHRGALSVDAAGAAHEPLRQAGWRRGTDLALRADHRHRLDLRLLVARQAYQSAVLAPLFIVLSFAWGWRGFLIVQAAMFAWNG